MWTWRQGPMPEHQKLLRLAGGQRTVGQIAPYLASGSRFWELWWD
jgi:hypothetical protein